MSEAENTLRYAIMTGIINSAGEPPRAIEEEIFKRIFEPHLIWAITDYLKELNPKHENSD